MFCSALLYTVAVLLATFSSCFVMLPLGSSVFCLKSFPFCRWSAAASVHIIFTEISPGSALCSNGSLLCVTGVDFLTFSLFSDRNKGGIFYLQHSYKGIKLHLKNVRPVSRWQLFKNKVQIGTNVFLTAYKWLAVLLYRISMWKIQWKSDIRQQRMCEKSLNFCSVFNLEICRWTFLGSVFMCEKLNVSQRRRYKVYPSMKVLIALVSTYKFEFLR